MAVGAIVARILTQYSDKGSKAAQKDIGKLSKQFDEFGKRTVRAFGIAAAAATAFAIKIGKDAVQAAIADQKSQVLLANSLRNTTGATTAAIASVESYISKLQVQVGVADDELRPALSRLAAVTGDVATAQQLLSTALDVSAFSGADLNSATLALTRAFQGNFRSLQKLVPSIDTTVIKSKDLVAIFEEVQKATSGAAAARAGTLEFRLAILRIRYEEILETLGYSLLPVLEEFSKTLTSDILPKVAKWVELNKKNLAEGLKNAAQAALELLKAAIKVGAWVVENFETIKTFGILLATIWATGKVYSFITAIGKVSLAFKGMQAAALGAGAASAAATGGAGAATAFLAGARALGIVGLGVTGIAALSLGLGKISPGEKARAKARATEKSLASATGRGAPGPSDLSSLIASSAAPNLGGNKKNSYLDLLNKLTIAQNKLTQGKKKELSVEQQIINKMLKKYGLTLMTAEIEAKATAASIEANLKRQSKIAASPTVSLATQGNGSAAGGNPIMGSGTPNVTVNITTPVGTAEDFTVKIANDLGVLARRQRGSVSPSGRPIGMVAE